MGTHPASPDDDAPAASGRGGEALPVPSDADDGQARLDTDGSRPLEDASEADDGLPSFSPGDVAPESPTGPGDALFEAATAPAPPGGETPSINDGLSLLSLADGSRGAFGLGGGACTPEAGDGGHTLRAEAAKLDVPPLGIVSPPATTVFGGGIGVALEAISGGNANVAHSVEVSESESLGTSPPAPASGAPEATATAAPVGNATSPSPESALQ